MKKIFALSTALLIITTQSFAAMSNPAKEDTNPPPAEGPLAADQIQPILTIGKPGSPAPAPAQGPAVSQNEDPNANAEQIHE